ncbi:MAG: Lpg1974 family pore-forming outer membrane protein [Planctomycetota bacterium]
MTRDLRAYFALVVGMTLTAAAHAAEDKTTIGAAFGEQAPVERALFSGGDNTVSTAGVVDELTGDIKLTQFGAALPGVGPIGPASGCNGQFFVGGEYLNVRANYSQAISFLTTDISTSPPSFTYNQFAYDYDSSFRIYGGYRVCDCGCEVRFTYTSIDSGGSFMSPEQPGDGSMTFTAPFEVITGGPGDTVAGTANVSIDNYDIGFAKTIPLGSPLCCDAGCGDCACTDGCGGCGCWCPAWDITFMGAIRVADVEAQQNYVSNIVSTTVAGLSSRVATSTMDFQGIGFRTGLLGRRYFGKSGIASIYMRGDISLLLGDATYTAVGTQFARHTISCTHVIPVTEIEAGGTIFLTRNASLSAGYMLAAWHDLGQKAEYDFGGNGVQLESFDDANILGLDGFFIRGELAF